MIKFELSIAYRNWLAHSYYQDFVSGADGSYVKTYDGRRGVDYMVVFESQDVAYEPYYKRSELARMRKADLFEQAIKYNSYCGYVEDYHKDTLIDDLLKVTKEQYYDKHYEETDRWYDLECDFESRGYCPGDATKVVFVGNVPYTKGYIDNLLWDSPVGGRLTIYEVEDGEFLHKAEETEIDEIDLYEFLDDEYKYDKGDLLSNFAKRYDGDYKNELYEYLEAHLPDNLDYED